MQAQATRPLFSGLTIRQARVLWVTLSNASCRALAAGNKRGPAARALADEISGDLETLANVVDGEFAGLLDGLEIYERPDGDCFLAPSDFYADSQAFRSATAGAR